MARLILEMKDRGAESLFRCTLCENDHMKLWTIQRARVRQLGHYITFRINGDEIMYDPTLPHQVAKLPRDAKPVDPQTASRAWHEQGHYFSLPNPLESKDRRDR